MFVCSVSTVVFNANPLLALRRLLHPRRPVRDPQPAAKGHRDPQPQDGRVVPGPGAARRPLPPAAQPDLLRPLLGRLGHLSLGGGVLDSLVPLQILRPVPPGTHRPDHRTGVAVGTGGHSALPTGQVPLCPREARQSEESPHVCHRGHRRRPCWRPCCWCRCRTA